MAKGENPGTAKVGAIIAHIRYVLAGATTKRLLYQAWGTFKNGYTKTHCLCAVVLDLEIAKEFELHHAKCSFVDLDCLIPIIPVLLNITRFNAVDYGQARI